jgi:hypothetical protein
VVDHRRRHIRVPQQLLDGPDVAAILELVRHERVAKRVTADRCVIPLAWAAAAIARCVTDPCGWYRVGGTIRNPQSAIRNLQSAISNQQSAICNLQSAILQSAGRLDSIEVVFSTVRRIRPA